MFPEPELPTETPVETVEEDPLIILVVGEGLVITMPPIVIDEVPLGLLVITMLPIVSVGIIFSLICSPSSSCDTGYRASEAPDLISFKSCMGNKNIPAQKQIISIPCIMI
jgi:hypothetical protein